MKVVTCNRLADGMETMLSDYLLAMGLGGAWATVAAFNILSIQTL